MLLDKQKHHRLDRCTHRLVSCLEADTAIRRRSVALGSDPAMKEMVHFVGSHEHDSRLKDTPERARVAFLLVRSVPKINPNAIHTTTSAWQWIKHVAVKDNHKQYVGLILSVFLYFLLRLQEAANIRSTILKDLPESFKQEVEILRQAEAFEDNRPLPVTSTGLLDGPSVDARLAWRQEMDRQVKRLLQDPGFVHFCIMQRYNILYIYVLIYIYIYI